MENTAMSEQKGDSSFWSPWIVFFFGVTFAALNWWRMGRKQKAIFFLVLNLFVSFLSSWIYYKGGVTPTDHAIFNEIIFARLFISFIFSSLLAKIMSNDIQHFNLEGRIPIPVKWQSIFVFGAILIVSSSGTWAALDFGAREMGKCRFPRLQDVIYQKEFEQRTGLATLVIGRNDFSCTWAWDAEIIEPIATNGYYLFMYNELDHINDPSLLVSEQLFQYAEVTPDEFSKILQNSRQLNYSEYPVEVNDPNAQYSDIHCVRSGENTFCNLLFGYQNIISQFKLDFSRLPDAEINSLIKLVVSTNSERIRAYEKNK